MMQASVSRNKSWKVYGGGVRTLLEHVSQDAVKKLKVPLLHPVQSASICQVRVAHDDVVRVMPTPCLEIFMA